MLDQNDRLECGCSVTARTYLYVGKNVLVRSRIQQHVFGKKGPPSPWLIKYQDDHGHNVYYEAWYYPKHQMETIETWLIGMLSPLYNSQQRSAGFFKKDAWVWEPPFVHGNACDVTVGRPGKNGEAARSWLKNTSGVYAFYVDPGNDMLAAHQATMSMPGLRNWLGKKSLPAALLERSRRARISKRLISSRPEFMQPIWIEESHRNCHRPDLTLKYVNAFNKRP